MDSFIHITLVATGFALLCFIVFILFVKYVRFKKGLHNWIWIIAFAFIPGTLSGMLLEISAERCTLIIGACISVQICLAIVSFILLKKYLNVFGLCKPLFFSNEPESKNILISTLFLIPLAIKVCMKLYLFDFIWSFSIKRLVLVGFLTPLLEEYVFRFLMPSVVIGNKYRISILISLIFAISHFYQGPTAVIVIFISSLYYFFAYWKTRHFGVSVILHALNNISTIFFH